MMYLCDLQPEDPKYAMKEAYILNSLRRNRERCEDIMNHIDNHDGFGAYKVLLQVYHPQMTSEEVVYYWRRAIMKLNNSYLIYLIYKDCTNKKTVYNGLTLEEIVRMPDWTSKRWDLAEKVNACKAYVHNSAMWNDVVHELWKEKNTELGRMNGKEENWYDLQKSLKTELPKIARTSKGFSMFHFVAVSYLVYQKKYVSKWESKMESFNMKGLVHFLGKIFSGEQLEQALEEVVYCFALYDTINYKMEELEPEVRKMKRELKRYLHS